MYWRLKRAEFDQKRGQGTKRALKKIVKAGQAPGILAYAEGEPIGWCSVAPRETFPVLDRSRILRPVDNQPVWSVVCFFVARPFRRKGVTVKLLTAAVEFAQQHGAQIVEGYPVEPRKDTIADILAYTGLASAFRQAGFVEALRRSETRPIMRYLIE
jgi:GNAT superfamily N-acetyltransferase